MPIGQLANQGLMSFPDMEAVGPDGTDDQRPSVLVGTSDLCRHNDLCHGLCAAYRLSQAPGVLLQNLPHAVHPCVQHYSSVALVTIQDQWVTVQ